MPDDEQLLRRYLLGETSEAERAALERKYFDDPRLFDRLVEAENDLVDSYARGRLPPPARERFERHYLAHPVRRERARFAETLAAKLEQGSEVAAASPARPEPAWSGWLARVRGPRLAWALSAALLLAAAGAAWLLIEARRPQQELANTGAERAAQEERRGGDSRQQPTDEAPRSEESPEPARPATEQQAARPSPSLTAKSAPALATLTLTVGGTRSAAQQPARLDIPAGARQVRLQLRLRENNYASYSAALRTAGGEEVYVWRRLTPASAKTGGSLALTLPAREFDDGDYILTLRGARETGEVDHVSELPFRVKIK